MECESPPLICVIIPVFNRERKLKRAIESVLNQTYRQFQLIIVDDCSTDNSFFLASGFDDERVKVKRTQKNSGAAAARNVGIQASSTPYIAFLDSDDIYHRDFLKLSLQAIIVTDSTYGFSYTGVGKLKDSDEANCENLSVWRMPDHFNDFKKPFLYQLEIGTAAGILVRKEVFEKVGFFDESLRVAEDTDWFIRVSEYYKGCPILQNLIFKDNDSPDRLTSQYGKTAYSYKLIIAKNYAEIHESSILVRRWYYKSMWLNLYASNKRDASFDYQMLKRKNQLSMKIRLTYFAGLILPARYFMAIHKLIARMLKINKRIENVDLTFVQ